MLNSTNRNEAVMRVVLAVHTTTVAFSLIIFFGIAPFLGLQITPSESIGIVEVVLPLFTGYLGLIIGYYFGEKERSR